MVYCLSSVVGSAHMYFTNTSDIHACVCEKQMIPALKTLLEHRNVMH